MSYSGLNNIFSVKITRNGSYHSQWLTALNHVEHEVPLTLRKLLYTASSSVSDSLISAMNTGGK